MEAKPNIDDIDVRILKKLLSESRITFTELAKDFGLSITSIRNRFSFMKKSGIITGAIMQINPKSIGFDCVAFVKIRTIPKYTKEVHKLLCENPHIATYNPHMIGRSSIVAFAVTRNTDDLNQIINQIRDIPNVKSVSIAMLIDVINIDYPQNLIIKKTDKLSGLENILPKKENNKSELIVKKEHVGQNSDRKALRESHELDDIDISLIKIFSRNARISFRKIAKNIGVSINTVMKKYRELRKTVLILSSITVDLTKLGYVGMGVMAIKISKGCSTEETFNRIIQIPNVLVATKVLGDFDILAIAPFKDFDDLANLTEEISNNLCVLDLDLTIDRPFTSWPLNLISELIIDRLSLLPPLSPA